jgi:NADH:ubiquinone oxidoreductase subunit K
MAAAVAAATIGLLGVLHTPNGMMFFMGMKSMMLAAGCVPDNTRFSGVTIKVEGAIPKMQVNVARLTT